MCGRDGRVSDLRTGEVTELLRAWHAGDEAAYARVSAMLYDELRARAARYMRRQRPGDSLQATALVHEAFLRLHNARQVDWHDRNHFLAVAARTMRRVLVDLARAKASAKRGGRPQHVTLDTGYRRSGARARASRSDRARRRARRARRDRPTQSARRRAPVLRRPERGRDGGGARGLSGHRRPRLAHGAQLALESTRRWIAIAVTTASPRTIIATKDNPVDPERWRQIERLYHSTLERPPQRA